MNNNKILGIALVAIAIIAIFGLFFPRVSQQVVQKIVGSVPTLDGIDSPFITINGQREWRGTVSFTATSSVICSLKNPLAATSSIEYLSAEATARGGLSQANNLTISTSTSQYATSTPYLLYDWAIGTGQWSVVFVKNSATTTAYNALYNSTLPGLRSTGSSNYFLAPSEYINFVIATSSPGGGGTFASYMTGKCTYVLKKI
jgi:hypothetical protein